MRPFDRCLSLRIDACYVEIERILSTKPTVRRAIRLALVRWKLRRLLRRMPV